MAKSLIIVESPAKAKTISRFLGREYKVVASMGHVRDLPKSQLGIDIEKGFVPKYITIRGKGPIIENLRKEAAKAQNVLLATDPDREGEAISWHLAHLLDIPPESPCRVEFHEITKTAVSESLRYPRKINMNLVDAQQARRILDRLVGYKISPILWRKVKWGLSAGRVQSAAVRMICDREREITEFVPEEYWTIEAELADRAGGSSFKAKLHSRDNDKIDLKNREQVEKIVADLQNEVFIVVEIKRGERRRNPAPPFTTSTMQQEAARKLGFTAKKTMMIAQQLYEGLDIEGEGTVGLVTYIRTDSTRISEQAQKEAKEYIKANYGTEYVAESIPVQRAKKNIQDAHEGIRPTSVFRHPDSIKDSLTLDQYKLYKLIWERFLASQMAPAVYDTVSVDIKAGSYIFKASGSTLKFSGFMAVYIEGADEEAEKDEGTLPILIEGRQLTLLKIMPEQHFTQPPPRFTEAMLVKALEEKGIGRPSTYAPIIDTIQKRGYVKKEKGRFKPTELGQIVTEILKEYFSDIVDLDFTAEMENQLDKVEAGEENWQKIIESFYGPFNEKLKIAEEKIEEVKIEDEVTEEKCEICGRNMVIKRGRYGEFMACSGFPECRNTKPLIEETGVKCPVCGGNIVLRKSKKGRKFYGCSSYPNCEFVTWDPPSKTPCPRCGGLMVEKSTRSGKTAVCINRECGYKDQVEG
ncbi:type I DNA topoisomerase [Thermosediminibacter litoriperuensis]|uniref:DNA topoisomerase 1 n=1 Tax=Thermosediminibacter litoriperuensis TaxID=291989 RepID=A0A5S5B0P7_9FIRM|nr:type I DNA topoisomerase [Thermosediminibacter litoriperuensis]TYP59942.1 DNA topoisomerase I [Thermosediminibacter litoriperuensis]